MKKILIVDDEPAILTLLQYNLEAEHYQVETATDGQEALDKVRSEPFDFIILDLMLPSLSGLDVTRKIREEKIQTPIMILTAKDNETDKIVGLELGADDYVTKPFSPREIIARIKAIERRSQSQPQAPLPGNANQITVGQITIDPENYKASKAGHRLQLTPRNLNYWFILLNELAKRYHAMLCSMGFGASITRRKHGWSIFRSVICGIKSKQILNIRIT